MYVTLANFGKWAKVQAAAGDMAKLSYGPNVLISLALLLLGVCAWLVLVSSPNLLQCCVIDSGRRLLPCRVLDI